MDLLTLGMMKNLGGGGSFGVGGVFKCEMIWKNVDGYTRYESLTNFADALAAYQRGDFVFAELDNNGRYTAVDLTYDSFEELWYMTLSKISGFRVSTITWASSGTGIGTVNKIDYLLEHDAV